MEIVFAILAGLFVVSQIFIAVDLHRRDRLVCKLHETWIDAARTQTKKNLDELDVIGTANLRDRKKLYELQVDRKLCEELARIE